MNKIGLWIILSGWLLSLSALAQEVGWINQFDGQTENYLLKRENKTVPVDLLKLLEVGDQISVTDKQHSIELNLQGGNQTVKVTYENSPFLIEANHQVPAELSELWKWTTKRFDEWHQLLIQKEELKKKQLEQEAKTRGEGSAKSPTMSLLANEKPDVTLQSAYLVAGKRPLYLQWHGGTPPYRVTIKKRLDELLTLTTEQTMITTEAITFDANSPYRVEIIDAKNNAFKGGFRAVNPESLPTHPEALPTNKLPEVVYQTLQAIWLTAQKEGNEEESKWIFEAYQQIAALANQYLPAQLLQQALAQGARLNTRGIRG
ncbi:secreted protein [Thioploca ingrica]|uniref:Secreted protein n=1 Tax=Thioploca ingrica TaxID=40754 RepID=A0A090AKF2_9GAMM|nr:secreted protein [Thioploca ingrica]